MAAVWPGILVTRVRANQRLQPGDVVFRCSGQQTVEGLGKRRRVARIKQPGHRRAPGRAGWEVRRAGRLVDEASPGASGRAPHPHAPNNKAKAMRPLLTPPSRGIGRCSEPPGHGLSKPASDCGLWRLGFVRAPAGWQVGVTAGRETRVAPWGCIGCSASAIVSSFPSTAAGTERPARPDAVLHSQAILLCWRMARPK